MDSSLCDRAMALFIHFYGSLNIMRLPKKCSWHNFQLGMLFHVNTMNAEGWIMGIILRLALRIIGQFLKA